MLDTNSLRDFRHFYPNTENRRHALTSPASTCAESADFIGEQIHYLDDPSMRYGSNESVSPDHTAPSSTSSLSSSEFQEQTRRVTSSHAISASVSHTVARGPSSRSVCTGGNTSDASENCPSGVGENNNDSRISASVSQTSCVVQGNKTRQSAARKLLHGILRPFTARWLGETQEIQKPQNLEVVVDENVDNCKDPQSTAPRFQTSRPRFAKISTTGMSDAPEERLSMPHIAHLPSPLAEPNGSPRDAKANTHDNECRGGYCDPAPLISSFPWNDDPGRPPEAPGGMHGRQGKTPVEKTLHAHPLRFVAPRAEAVYGLYLMKLVRPRVLLIGLLLLFVSVVMDVPTWVEETRDPLLLLAIILTDSIELSAQILYTFAGYLPLFSSFMEETIVFTTCVIFANVTARRLFVLFYLRRAYTNARILAKVPTFLFRILVYLLFLNFIFLVRTRKSRVAHMVAALLTILQSFAFSLAPVPHGLAMPTQLGVWVYTLVGIIAIICHYLGAYMTESQARKIFYNYWVAHERLRELEATFIQSKVGGASALEKLASYLKEMESLTTAAQSFEFDMPDGLYMAMQRICQLQQLSLNLATSNQDLRLIDWHKHMRSQGLDVDIPWLYFGESQDSCERTVATCHEAEGVEPSNMTTTAVPKSPLSQSLSCSLYHSTRFPPLLSGVSPSQFAISRMSVAANTQQNHDSFPTEPTVSFVIRENYSHGFDEDTPTSCNYADGGSRPCSRWLPDEGSIEVSSAAEKSAAPRLVMPFSIARMDLTPSPCPTPTPPASPAFKDGSALGTSPMCSSTQSKRSSHRGGYNSSKAGKLAASCGSSLKKAMQGAVGGGSSHNDEKLMSGASDRLRVDSISPDAATNGTVTLKSLKLNNGVNGRETCCSAPSPLSPIPLRSSPLNRLMSNDSPNVDAIGLKFCLDMFDLHKLTKENSLVQVGFALLRHHTTDGAKKQCKPRGLTDSRVALGCPETVLLNFLVALQHQYRTANSYHNAVHAAEVTHLSVCLARLVRLFGPLTHSQVNSPNCANSSQTPRLPRQRALDEVAFIVAALGHDAGHPGRNNQFFLHASEPLALVYNDISVLENYHCYLTFRALTRGQILSATVAAAAENPLSPLRSDLLPSDLTRPSASSNIFECVTVAEYRCARKRIIELILATDMAHHFTTISASRVRRESPEFNVVSNEEDFWMVAKLCLKAADVGHAALDWPQHYDWCHRVIEEFYAQGDEEAKRGLAISPFCDRAKHGELPKSQCGFIQFVVLPLVSELESIEFLSATTTPLYQGDPSPRQPNSQLATSLGVSSTSTSSFGYSANGITRVVTSRTNENLRIWKLRSESPAVSPHPASAAEQAEATRSPPIRTARSPPIQTARSPPIRTARSPELTSPLSGLAGRTLPLPFNTARVANAAPCPSARSCASPCDVALPRSSRILAASHSSPFGLSLNQQARPQSPAPQSYTRRRMDICCKRGADTTLAESDDCDEAANDNHNLQSS